MKKIPTITINNPNRIINTNVPNTGGGSGNQFTNWTPPTGNFGGNTGNSNINIPTFNPPSMNIPSNIPTGNNSFSNNVKLPETNTQQIFENDFDNTGVMNYTGGVTPENIIQLAHLINVRSTMKNGWGPNVLMNLKVLNLSGSSLSGPELSPLFKSMYYQKMDLNLLDLSYNKMCDNSVGEMLWSIGNEEGKQVHAIKTLKINNNQFGDQSAEYFNWHLSSGSLKYTKHIDISGNNITQTGDTWIVQTIKGVWQDIAVFTHKLDEIVKMDEGTKEEKVAIYKAIIEKGKSLGTYDKAMVVDKSWFGKVEHGAKHVAFKFKWLFGFSKCHLLPDPKEEVTSYAQDKIIATLPEKTATGLGIAKKGVGVLTKHYDFVTCFISTTDAVWSSELGQEIAKHELCLLGEQDFCHGEQ